MTERVLSQSASGRDKTFVERLRRDTTRQSAQREIRKTLNVEKLELLFRIQRSKLRWFGHVTRMAHERLASPSACTHGKTDQRSTKDHAVWLHLRPGLFRFSCEASEAIRGCWNSSGILKRPTAAASARSKAGVNTNECKFLFKSSGKC